METTKRKVAKKAEIKKAVRKARELLKQNPKLSYKELAPLVGTSAATLQRRGLKRRKAKTSTVTIERSDSELLRLVHNLEDAKKALRDYLEAYLSL